MIKVRRVSQQVNLFKTVDHRAMHDVLVEELCKLKENYRKQFNEIELNKDQNNLEFIYNWIKKINEIKMINALKKLQEILMKQYEIDPID
ncbi:unnamed protein product [Adineta steineri]|uniref:Uncharacterized protein n=1 Tax=Adineta steineri TaxID=433720 RepID=A0A813XQ03_9BILA|nr:unnamed protein product [Adineta steineri]CAF3602458.1 unnamed protein product [Adineta steineri]